MKQPEAAEYNHYFDVAIIGGGPAGALAATLLAEAGFSTAVIERKNYPRHKICGGFLSARAAELLPGDLLIPLAKNVPVHSLEFVCKKKTYSYNSRQKLGILLDRSIFDSQLIRHAVERGAVLFENKSIINIQYKLSETGNKNVYHLQAGKSNQITLSASARYVIGADGALGKTAYLAGISPKRRKFNGQALSSILPNIEENSGTGTLTFFPLPFSAGMGWSFKAKNYYNRGVGGFAGRSRLARDYVRLFPNNMNNQSHYWPLPFLGPLRKIATGNLLLIGDAAGLIEPFSGEGLYNAFKSAYFAVQAIKEADKKKVEAEATYNRLFKKHFRAKFIATLLGAVLLNLRAAVAPSTMPLYIARLMENKLWFNDAIQKK